MSLPSGSAEAISYAGPTKSDNARLRGRWLVIGRILWLALVAFGLSVLGASLSPTFHLLQTVCIGSACASSQLTPEQAQTLQRTLGLSLSVYAVFVLCLSVASTFFWIGAGVLLWRKFGEKIVLLVALQAVTQGVLGSNAFATNGLVDVFAQVHSPWQAPALLLEGTNQILLFFVFALFPNGRFVPRWMRWVGALWIVFDGLYMIGRNSPPLQSSLPTFNPGFLGVIFLVIIAQVYRYWRVSTGVERQQTKWVIIGLLAQNIVQVGLLLPEVVFAPLRQPNSLYGPVASQVLIFGYLLGPASIIIAVLRYRLWDVDALLNKALVYGLLTGLLVALYAGLVIGLESLAGAITGQAGQQPVVLVISTLAIAALFHPLRRSIQNMIDRRFYRRKYDAARTLEAFSATLRNEVDLNELREYLLAVVQETMQPAHVSLWLRPPERRPEEQPQQLEPQR